MDKNAQNIAIAEFCGWTGIHAVTMMGRIPEHWTDGARHQDIPNYCGDLNAMAQAEKCLQAFQKVDYVNILAKLNCEARLLRAASAFDYFNLLSSPSDLRAEAYVKTIGKWKE